MKKQLTAFLSAAVLTCGAVPAAETILPDFAQTGISASAADYTPAKVTGVKASSITQTAATLKWSKAAKAKGYRIYIYNTKTKKYTKVTTISKNTTTSYKLTGLKADTTYKYKVRAYNKVNGKTIWGTSSAAVTVKTKSYTPAQVTGLKAISLTDTTGKLTWTKVSGAKGYRVYVYNTSTKKYEKLTTISNADTTSYKLSGLKAGTEYKYKVRAYTKQNGTTYWGKPSDAYTLRPSDNETAKAVRQAGEEEFYSFVEFAQMYNWSAENIKVLRETDTQYGICVEFYSPINRDILVACACKAEIVNGEIQVLWCNPTVGDSRGAPIPENNYTYDNFEYREDFGKDRLITLIKDYGYTN